MRPRYFKTQAELRSWFVENHDSLAEVWIGFYIKASGKISVSYAEAVDEALCFGWIDGIRKKVDQTRYANRFTPRRTKSSWSKTNIENVKRLAISGKMTRVGLEAINRKKPKVRRA